MSEVQDSYKSIWFNCLEQLKEEIDNQDFNTWVRPLKFSSDSESNKIILLAPNRFIVNWVQEHYSERINDLITQFAEQDTVPSLSVRVKDTDQQTMRAVANNTKVRTAAPAKAHNLNLAATFEHLSKVNRIKLRARRQ